MSLIKSHYTVDKPHFKRIQRWVWVCIYAGLLLMVMSYFVQPMDASLADWGLRLGVALVAVGCVLIYVRSRMEE